ncbi:MAG: choice-of-anchor D domain-containing protein [Lewinellaceae bacterium]|nr:choice-of-anchor D domain-containing protein [Lewinellaceae bacterium]
MSVSGTGTTNPVAVLSVNPLSLNFGTFVHGGSSESQSFTISNPGTAGLIISNFTLPNGFSANWTGGNIQSGNSQTIDVTFNPVNQGNFSNNITINSNAGSITVSLQAVVGQNNNFISGTVKDIINTSTGSSGLVEGNIEAGKTVNLYSGNSQIQSVQTNASGAFLFNNVTQTNLKINILINTSLSGQLSVWKNNVTIGTNYTIKAPKSIMEKIDTLEDELEQIDFDLVFWDEVCKRL